LFCDNGVTAAQPWLSRLNLSFVTTQQHRVYEGMLNAMKTGQAACHVRHKQTLSPRNAMSALPPKAKIVKHGGNVRFVPEADVQPTTARLPGQIARTKYQTFGGACHMSLVLDRPLNQQRKIPRAHRAL